MNQELDRLFARIHAIEHEIEQRLAEHRAPFGYRIDKGKAAFDPPVKQAHRGLRMGLLRYLREARFKHIVTVPVIYASALAFLLLDATLTLYQWICFSAWGIARVRRRDYIVIDRHRLGYLNVIEKMNCVYCGYANGILAYAREIAGRTEQYWCPIRHATQIRGAHARYREFVDYGDAAGYRARLEELRARLR